MRFSALSRETADCRLDAANSMRHRTRNCVLSDAANCWGKSNGSSLVSRVCNYGFATVLCFLLGIGMQHYFELRMRAFSPALGEARLQALQARIRPHFLFNSLNAVLS